MTILGQRFVFPYQTAIDIQGNPIPGAQLEFFFSDTEIPLATYADAALTIPNDNPVTTTGSTGTFPSIFLTHQPYKVRLLDACGDEIWTADPVGEDGSDITYAPSFEYIGNGQPFANDILGMHSFVAEVVFAGGFLGSTGNAITPPNSLYTATIYRNTTVVGTMTISIAGGFGFTTVGNLPITFELNDVMIIQGAAIPDATLANFSWTLAGVLAA